MSRKTILEPITTMQDPAYAGGPDVLSEILSVKNLDYLKIEFTAGTTNISPITMTVYSFDKFKDMQPNSTYYSDGIPLDFGSPITLDSSDGEALITIDCTNLNSLQIVLSAAVVTPGDEFDYKVTVTGKVVGA